MAGFDWDSQEDATGFDWDTQEDVDKPGVITSAVRQGVHGATAGFMDEIAGLGEAGGRALGIEGVGSPISELGLADDGPTLDWQTLRDAYRKARDREREATKRDYANNPGASTTGNLVGAIASPINKIFPAGGGSPGVASTLPALAGNVAPKAASLATQGAVTGAITGLGESNSESLSGMAGDTALSSLLGGVVGKTIDVGTPLIQKGFEKASAGSRDMAEALAARALGAERGTIKKMGYDKVKRAAGQALDEGVLPIFSSTDEMINKNTAIGNRGGAMMGEVYDEIDNVGASTFHPHDVAGKVDDQLGDIWRTPLNKGEVSQFDNTIETILARGDGDIPLREAQALKEELGRAANWKNKLSITPKEQMARDAYGIVNKSIDDAVNQGMGAVETVVIDGKPLREVLAQGKKLYGNSQTAAELLENKMAREQGNKMFGLTDTIAGAGALGYGGTTNDWEGAGGIMLAKKGFEKYGAKAGAHGMNKISQILQKSPNLAGTFAKAPQVLGSMSQKLSEAMGANNEAPPPFDKNSILQKANGTQYASVLQKAAERGDQAFGATHFLLQSTDPQYRQALNQDDMEP